MAIDSFMLFQEWDLLDLRLHELDPIVSHYIIVESLEYHGSSRIKTETLRDHWDIVKPFENKVKYILLDQLEPPYDGRNHWQRENFNRNALMAGIVEIAGPKDIVILSDADEIPRTQTITDNLNKIQNGLYVLEQELFYSNVNTFKGNWNGSIVGSLASFQQAGGLQNARNRRDSLPRISGGGWHMSYFGDISKIRQKVDNFAHSSDGICRDLMNRSDKELAMDILEGRDIYHRNETKYPRRDSDDYRLPKYYLENRDKFRKFTDEAFREQYKELL